MLRIALTLSLLLPLPALADDVQVPAPVTEVVAYPRGASLTRNVAVDLPAGESRILMPISAESLRDGPPRISGRGAFTLGAVEVLDDVWTDPTRAYSDVQRAALDRVESLEEERDTQDGLLVRARAALAAAEAELAFLTSVSAGALESLDAAELSAAGAAIRTGVTAASIAKREAEEAAAIEQKALLEIMSRLEQAKRDLERTYRPMDAIDMLAVTVDLPEAQSIELELVQLISRAGWRPDYDLRLTRETGVVDVDRKVVVFQSSPEQWVDVTLTLSTADPYAQLDPREPFPNRAQLINPANQRRLERSFSSDLSVTSAAESLELQSAPDEEAVIVLEATTVIDGLSVSYNYPQPVTLSPNDGDLILTLDSFPLEAELFNRASPRHDQTAFLMARVTNTMEDPLLPGQASIYRDGVFIGRNALNLVPAGQETTLSFGTLEGLRLDYTLLENDTGDRGLISSSSTRRQSMEFTVENLTSEPEDVQTLFALPYAEEEDLDIRLSTRPVPTSEDFKQKRGVAVWDLSLAPGQKQTVRIDVDLSWPEGQQMIWNP